MKRRLTAIFLCLCLLFTLLPATALAEGETDGVPSPAESALCEHHPQHDGSCGYTEGSAGTPCAHAHSGDCYAPVTSCVHTHTADCFPAAPADGAGNAPEDPAAPAEPAACAHVCSAESGCVTNVLDCHHTHDAACGYVPAVEGTPCGYVCEICRSQEGGEAEETAPEGTGPEETAPEETAPTDPEPTEPEPEPESTAPDPEAVCLCAQRCTENSVNADCPVCSAGGADLSACLGAVPAAALAAAAARASGHTTNHPLCGAACDGSHNDLTWKPLSVPSDNELPSGNYYLEEDLQIASMLIIADNATVNLCLNGHVLEYTGSDLGVSVIKIGLTPGSTSILNVCDCSAGAEHRFTVEDNGLWKLDGNGAQSLSGGVITGGENGGIYLHASGVVLNLYGGNIAGNHGCGIWGYGGVNLYGGSVTGNVADEDVNGLAKEKGGGIRARRVHIYGGSVANNRASSAGGGVYVNSGNSFTMEGGTISGNTAAGSGGGVYVAEKNDASSLPGGTFTMEGGTISGNEAQYIGGGIYVNSGGTFTMEGGSITGNNARTTSDDAAGGGVSVAGGSFTMEGGVIRGNGADNGGGVGLGGNGRFTMKGGEISQNHASTAGGHKNHGGGVCILSGTFTMTGGEIINNQAPYGHGGGIALKNQGGGTMTATVSISGNSQITGNKQASGGGVHMLSGGQLELGGTPKITGNTTSGREVNLYFPSGITNTSITLAEPLKKGAEIGITNDSGDSISIIDQTGSAPSFAQFFQSDAAGFHVVISKWGLVLAPDFYHVVFHRNLGGDETTQQQFYYNQPQKLQANPFGLQALFTGWNTRPDGTGTPYQDGEVVCNLTTEHGATVHLYAQWDLGPYTVTLETNGGTIAEGKDITSYIYGESRELPKDNEITRTGYTFQGWKDANGKIVTKISSSDHGAKTFTAQWEPITYIVAFVANGGSGTMTSQPFDYDEEKALTANGFTRTGHDFTGWNTAADGQRYSLCGRAEGEKPVRHQWRDHHALRPVETRNVRGDAGDQRRHHRRRQECHQLHLRHGRGAPHGGGHHPYRLPV